MDREETPLEEIVAESTAKKIALVDTMANITYSLVVGTLLDLSAGLRGYEILASRTFATGANTVTGAPYGWWREKVFQYSNTTEDSSKVKTFCAEMFATNTFFVPVYSGIVAAATYLSHGEVNLEKVQSGAINIFLLSPFIAPTLGWYTDRCRKMFGVKSAADGAYGNG